jgi:integrase
MSNQKMNDYLKELGKIAKFNDLETIVYFRGNERIEETLPKHELLTTHCARKTFVTNLIYLGVSDHVIKQWTGHKDNKSFEVYHKMVDEIKAREMAKFDNI